MLPVLTPFFAMKCLATIAVALQTVEMLQIRESFGRNGIWSWTVIRRELDGIPAGIRSGLDFLLNDDRFPTLLQARLVLAFAAPIVDFSLIWALLWLSTVLIALRWRGTFNGGSDYMTLIVLAAIAVGRCGEETSHPRWTVIAMGYVAFQTGLSFFVAGIAKLRHREWRNGSGLAGFLHSDYYAVPGWARPAIDGRRGRVGIGAAAWAIMAFECLFPFALADPGLALAAIVGAVVFQIANAYVFGLNRFLWAWGAAYPAFYWCSVYLTDAR